MIAGDLYRPGDPELAAARRAAQQLTRTYNQTIFSDDAPRDALLGALLGHRGERTQIRAPFRCDYGFNIRFGDGCFVNFGGVFLDVCPIIIGDNCQIGPNVQILTADHPRNPAERDAGLENGKPISLGRNVWIGGGAILLPGVRVGDDAIIGAGAVVTKDVAAGETVVGNPARPLATH